MNNKKRVVFDLTLMAICAPLLNVTKLALAFLPNIEPVTLLLIIYTLVLGFKKSIIISLLFIAVEPLIWGINIYILQYLLVWPLLVILTQIFKEVIKENFLLWAIFSGAFGLLFGVLTSIPLMIFDKTFTYANIISGLPFDALHLVGNYFLMIFLGETIYKKLKELKSIYGYRE